MTRSVEDNLKPIADQLRDLSVPVARAVLVTSAAVCSSSTSYSVSAARAWSGLITRRPAPPVAAGAGRAGRLASDQFRGASRRLAERYRPSADLAWDGQRLACAGAGAAPRPNPGPAEAATPPSSRRSYSAPATTPERGRGWRVVRRLARPPPMIAILLGSDDTTSGARQWTRIHTVSLRHRRFGMRGSVRINTRNRIPKTI